MLQGRRWGSRKEAEYSWGGGGGESYRYLPPACHKAGHQSSCGFRSQGWSQIKRNDPNTVTFGLPWHIRYKIMDAKCNQLGMGNEGTARGCHFNQGMNTSEKINTLKALDLLNAKH